MTPVFGLCEDYVTRWAALDPVAAELHGITAAFGAGTDYGPDGVAARADLITGTLAALAPMSITSDTDRLAASFLRERLEAQLAWHQMNEPLRMLSAPIGLSWRATSARTTHPRRQRSTAWAPNATRWPPGSAWVLTSTSRRLTSGAGPNSAGSRRR